MAENPELANQLTHRVVSSVKRELAKLLDEPYSIDKPKLYEEYVNRLLKAFPQIHPVEVGPARLIHSFKIERGRRRVHFLSVHEETVEFKVPNKIRGNRRLRKWAKRQVGKMICDVVFTPIIPVNSINISFKVAKDAAHPFVPPEEHSAVQGPLV